MGVVYLATQVSLARRVAVKVLPRELAGSSDFRARFEREARAAAALQHPFIVQVFAAGITDGLPWFAMEYVEGKDLLQLLRAGERFTFRRVAEIGRDTALALEEAHRAGYVHRDVKPGNIMVDSRGRLRVMDFGLARAVESSVQITQTHMIMGTPRYMSPEQATGLPVDIRSDLYSLGVVLYELLAGQPPFLADSVSALIFHHVNTPAEPLAGHRPDVPKDIARVVERLLEKKPEDRFQTPDDVARALDRAAGSLRQDEEDATVASRGPHPSPSGRGDGRGGPPDAEDSPTITEPVEDGIEDGDPTVRAPAALLLRAAGGGPAAAAPPPARASGEARTFAGAPPPAAAPPPAEPPATPLSSIASAPLADSMDGAEGKEPEVKPPSDVVVRGAFVFVDRPVPKEERPAAAGPAPSRPAPPPRARPAGYVVVDEAPGAPRGGPRVGPPRKGGGIVGLLLAALLLGGLGVGARYAYGRYVQERARRIDRAIHIEDPIEREGALERLVREVPQNAQVREALLATRVEIRSAEILAVPDIGDRVAAAEAFAAEHPGRADAGAILREARLERARRAPYPGDRVRLAEEFNAAYPGNDAGHEVLDRARQALAWFGAPAGEVPAGVGPVRAMAFAPDGATLAAGGDDRSIALFATSDLRPAGRVANLADAVLALAFDPAGSVLLAGLRNGSIHLVDVRMAAPGRPVRVEGGDVTALAFAPSLALAAVGRRNGEVRVVALPAGTAVATFAAHGAQVSALAFSPDGLRLATGSDDHTARIFGVVGGAPIATLDAHRDSITGIAWSPDGRLLATAASDRTARIWNTETGLPAATLRAHIDSVRAVLFDPRGLLLATGSADRAARLWTVPAGESLAALRDHGDWVRCLAFSPDGRLLATGSEDRSVRLWHVALGE